MLRQKGRRNRNMSFMRHFRANRRFKDRLERALKHGGFSEEDKLMARSQPNPATRELMEAYGVKDWSAIFQKKVRACEKLLVQGVTSDNPQLAAIAYACLEALARTAAKEPASLQETYTTP